MSERYSRIYDIKKNQYVKGSPILVSAGALLKDNYTGKLLAQIKFQNIGSKIIKAVKVSITQIDIAGNPLEHVVEHQYLDLKVYRDDYFGAKEAIPLSDLTTREFVVLVSEVIFVDNSVWKNSEKFSSNFSEFALLEHSIVDNELVKQFKIKYGSDCKYTFEKQSDLWICVCGAVNHEDEVECHKCKKSAEILANVNFEELKKECEERLFLEKQQLQEQQVQEEMRKREIKKHTLKYAPIVLAAVIVLCVIGVVVSNNINQREAERKEKEAYEIAQKEAYDNAVSLFENGEYEQAIDAFFALGEYKDSKEQIQKAEEQRQEIENKIKSDKYKNAKFLLNDGKVTEAKELFVELNDFEDSKMYVEEIEKQSALIEQLYQCLSLDEPESSMNQTFPDKAKELLEKFKGTSDIIIYEDAIKAYQDFVDGYEPLVGEFEIVSKNNVTNVDVNFFDIKESTHYIFTQYIKPNNYEYHIKVAYTDREGKKTGGLLHFKTTYGSTDFKLTGFVSANFAISLNDKGNVVLRAYNNNGLNQSYELKKVRLQ